jgi:gas vesicle protein
MAQAKKEGVSKVKVALGVGAGLAAAAAAAYLLTGERGKQNRAKIKEMTKSMHADIKSELKNLKANGKKEYHAIIEKVLKMKKA